MKRATNKASAKSPLVSRWKTPAGKIAAQAVENAFRTGTTIAELQGYVRNLPGVAEVAPALDLRGIGLPTLIGIQTTDLSGVRFDGAQMNWNFAGCALRRAVFDGASGHNVDFSACDLTGSSFVDASLPGAVFFGATLVDADLTRIRMRSGQLKDADCRRANFTHADLRIVWAADADLRGANLSDANLVGASLGRARWDEHTRCAGARFGWEGTPADLAAHALAQGATLRSEKPDWELALLDATRVALEHDNDHGRFDRLIARIAELRPEVERDPRTPWGNLLREGLPPEQHAGLDRAVRTAASNIGALLG